MISFENIQIRTILNIFICVSVLLNLVFVVHMRRYTYKMTIVSVLAVEFICGTDKSLSAKCWEPSGHADRTIRWACRKKNTRGTPEEVDVMVPVV